MREARSFWIVIQMIIIMGDNDGTDAEERHPLLFLTFVKESRRSFLRVVRVGQMPTTPSSVTSAHCLVDIAIDDGEAGDVNVQDELTLRRNN